MASVRKLKKDIRFLASELALHAHLRNELSTSGDVKKLHSFIEEVVDYQLSLLARANNPDGRQNALLTKAHYRKIREDMARGFQMLYSKL